MKTRHCFTYSQFSNRFHLCLILLMLYTQCLRAQAYVAFPDSNARWTTAYEIYNNTRIYSVKGDTVFNGHIYKKYYTVSDTSQNPLSFQYFAMARQDLSLKKVVGIEKGSVVEKLLYNFNLNLNDTVTVYSFGGVTSSSLTVKVTAKDSVLVHGQYRKRLTCVSYHTSLITPEYWIEGVGSNLGPFNPGLIDHIITDACYPKLLCFIQNVAVTQYANSCFAEPCAEVGIKELDLKNNIRLLTNPVDDVAKLEVKGRAEGEMFSIKISDISGKIIKSELIKAEGDIISINVTTFEKGIYFLTLYVNSSLIAVRKIIKE